MKIMNRLELAEYVSNHAMDIDWLAISSRQDCSEDFIIKYSDKVDWRRISKYQKLSEEFIIKYDQYIYWQEISIFQKLTEDFIRKYHDKVHWRFISKYQVLSEDFITEHHAKLDWDHISKYQVLSEDFIAEYHDKFNWDNIHKYQTLSCPFRIKHYSKFGYRIQHKMDEFLIDNSAKLPSPNINESMSVIGMPDVEVISANKIAIYPGSFDPISIGHVSIITKAAKIFDRICIVVADNSNKKHLFEISERIQMVIDAVSHLENVKVLAHIPETLIISTLEKTYGNVIIRGVRNASDFEYEFGLSYINKMLAAKSKYDIETVFFLPNEEHIFISSSLIRELVKYQEFDKLKPMVSQYVFDQLVDKYKNPE